MSRTPTLAAALMVVLGIDACLWGFSALDSLLGLAGLEAQVPGMKSLGWGFKLVVAGVWIAWMWDLWSRLPPARVPDRTVAVAAFCVPLVRLVAPAWVMWRVMAVVRPASRWLVPVWFLAWLLSRTSLSAPTGNPRLDLAMDLASVLGCFAALALVQTLERGLAELAGDRVGG
jgi:hypothetical protein